MPGSARGELVVGLEFDEALPEEALEDFEQQLNLLLDTHAFLWWATDDPRMSPRAREIIADGGNTLFFSAPSGWEIDIKARLGRLQVPGNLGRFLPEQLIPEGYQGIAHTPELCAVRAWVAGAPSGPL